MSYWADLIPLGELGKIVSGSTPKSHVKEYWDGDIPWITPANLTNHDAVYFKGKLRKITKAGFDSCSTTMLPEGSILFSSRAPIGHCAVTSFPLCTNQGFKSIIPNQKMDAIYGYFALRFFTPKIVAQGRGATFAEVSKEIVENFHIPLPPLPEQERIAAILEKADRLRRIRRYTQRLSDTFLQSVFLEMFGDPIANPKGWKTDNLQALCEQIIDCPHSTPKYALNKTPYACVRSSDIQRGYFDWSTTKYVSFEEYQRRIERIIPVSGDVIYCREGARFGNAARVPVGKKVCLGQRMMLFRANFELATSEFIWAFLNHESTYQQAIRWVGGSASPHVDVGAIKEFATIIPSLPFQEKFAQAVQRHERLRTQQQEAELQAEHLFQTLLHQAFQDEL